ncbi:hypothetical protein TKK_0015717 [Trichogramma kaykai]
MAAKVRVRKNKIKRGSGGKIKKVKFLTFLGNMKKSMSSGNNSISATLKKAQAAIKARGGRKNIILPRVLPISNKIGGSLAFLVPLFSGLSAAGALAGGVANITRAVNQAKIAKSELEEMKQHNRKMEAIALGQGLYLKSTKKGYGLYLNSRKRGGGLCFKKKKNVKIVLPKHALSNVELIKFAKLMKIPHFRGVYMRDRLPKDGPRFRECAIVNLDSEKNVGSHWVAFHKNGFRVIYFDSFGDLPPPRELMKYWNVDYVYYNYKRFQKFNSHNCGHLCLQFLAGEGIKEVNSEIDE